MGTDIIMERPLESRIDLLLKAPEGTTATLWRIARGGGFIIRAIMNGSKLVGRCREKYSNSTNTTWELLHFDNLHFYGAYRKNWEDVC